MYMNPDCSVCFSAMFPCASQLHHLVLPSIVPCASQLHHLVLPSIVLCASQLHHLVLPSIFAFFLPGFDSAAFGS